MYVSPLLCKNIPKFSQTTFDRFNLLGDRISTLINHCFICLESETSRQATYGLVGNTGLGTIFQVDESYPLQGTSRSRRSTQGLTTLLAPFLGSFDQIGKTTCSADSWWKPVFGDRWHQRSLLPTVTPTVTSNKTATITTKVDLARLTKKEELTIFQTKNSKTNN